MVKAFINSVNPSFMTEAILKYTEESHTQAEIVMFLIDQITERVLTNGDV